MCNLCFIQYEGRDHLCRSNEPADLQTNERTQKGIRFRSRISNHRQLFGELPRSRAALDKLLSRTRVQTPEYLLRPRSPLHVNRITQEIIVSIQGTAGNVGRQNLSYAERHFKKLEQSRTQEGTSDPIQERRQRLESSFKSNTTTYSQDGERKVAGPETPQTNEHRAEETVESGSMAENRQGIKPTVEVQSHKDEKNSEDGSGGASKEAPESDARQRQEFLETNPQASPKVPTIHLPADTRHSGSQERQKDQGLGDTVKRVTSAIGVKPCGGCQKRAEALNKFFPYTNTTTDLRKKVVEEARSFLGTKYHKGGLLKNIGVDCGTFPFLVYKNTGLILPGEEGIFADENIVPRPQDWFANTKEEKYLNAVLRYSQRVIDGMSYPTLKAEPGNLALTRCANSKRFNHAGIVVKWPRILHCLSDGGVQEADASTHWMWGFREVAIFDPFKKATEAR